MTMATNRYFGKNFGIIAHEELGKRNSAIFSNIQFENIFELSELKMPPRERETQEYCFDSFVCYWQ